MRWKGMWALLGIATLACSDEAGDGGNATGCEAPPSGWRTVLASGPTAEEFAQHEVAVAASRDGVIYALWMNERGDADEHFGGGKPLTGTLGFAVSEDRGCSFEIRAAPRAGLGSDFSADPALAVAPDGRLHATWIELDYDTGRRHVYHAFSDDHGRSFSPPRPLDSPGLVQDRDWVATDRDGRVYVVWTGGVASLDTLFLARSADGGNTWSLAVLREPQPGRATVIPSVSAAGAGVAVSWREDVEDTGEFQFLVTESADGETYPEPRRVEPLSDPSAWGFMTYPRVVRTSKGELFFSYTRAGWQVSVARSVAGGPFEEVVVAPDQVGAGMAQLLTALAVSQDGTLHVAWMAGSIEAWDAFYTVSTDGGRTFASPRRITDRSFAHELHLRTGDFTELHRMGDFNELAVFDGGVTYGYADKRSGRFEVRLATGPPGP